MFENFEMLESMNLGILESRKFDISMLLDVLGNLGKLIFRTSKFRNIDLFGIHHTFTIWTNNSVITIS